MKKLVALALALLMVLASACIAEEIPFSEWIAGQDHVVTDVFPEETPVPGAPAPEAPAFEPIGVGSRGETVAQIQAKLIELGILNSKADGIFGPASEAAVKYTQKVLGWEETGVIQTADELNTILALVPGDGVNLAVGTSDEWSEWMTPEYNVADSLFTVATVYPGEKQIGDPYTCQVEVEFADVTAMNDGEHQFSFFTQGRVDDEWKGWSKKNAWDRSLIDLSEAPANGVVKYTATRLTTAEGVMSDKWELGFRCDYWASGRFRVRCVKMEKGTIPTKWSRSPKEVGDGANLAVGSSDEWSEWMTPEYNVADSLFTVATVYPGEKQIGDPYTCQVEVEFADVTAMNDGEHQFSFFTQGRVDDEWKGWSKKNAWDRSLIDLSEAPANGVVKYTATRLTTAEGVMSDKWELGFRCDYWASGRFRVRCVKMEKGIGATEWRPAS